MEEGVRNHNILVVEDESAIRESLVEMLTINEFNASGAEHGLAGWQVITNNAPDLVISDVMMPKMDGFELLKKVRENKGTETLPVIMLTAKVELESKLHGLELGADDYITKPFEFRELKLKIGNLLQRREKMMSSAHPGGNGMVLDSQEDLFLRKLNLLLNEQLEDAKLLTGSIADQLNMSLSTFNRRLQKVTEKSPNQYVKEYRLKKAQQMIRLKYGNISEIANKTGFGSPAYFSSSYKEFFGKNPTDELSGN